MNVVQDQIKQNWFWSRGEFDARLFSKLSSGECILVGDTFSSDLPPHQLNGWMTVMSPWWQRTACSQHLTSSNSEVCLVKGTDLWPCLIFRLSAGSLPFPGDTLRRPHPCVCQQSPDIHRIPGEWWRCVSRAADSYDCCYDDFYDVFYQIHLWPSEAS